MASSQAGGNPDAVREDAVDVFDVGDAEEQLDLQWHDGEYADPTSTESPGATFNAFDASTWDISPTAAPWYQSNQAMATWVVAAAAAVTLVVSVVLLAVRGSATVDEPALIDNLNTERSSALTAPSATVAVKPPPAEAPPPQAPPQAYVPVVARPGSEPQQQAPPTARVSRTSVPTPPPTPVTVKAPPPRAHTP